MICCERMKIYESGVPLFKHSKDLIAKTKTIGNKLKRTVVCRSIEMEKLILSETDKLVDDWKHDQAMERTKKLRPDLYKKFLND